MTRLLLVNPQSGRRRSSAADLVRAARERGIETRVLRRNEEPAAAVPDAIGALGVAGGDGTLATVAEVALERDLPFVCIPFGTRNHFARDLGLDRGDAVDALAAFDGAERRIDVGRANGRLFLNNVSLGLYARLVHRRERHRRRREALARLRAWLIVLRHREPLGIRIDGRPEETRLVLVANNAYVLEPPTIGARERLDEGLLHVYVVRAGVEERTGARFVVDAAVGRLAAAVDGEPDVLETPIEFRIEPRALRVLVPPGV
jgi:diacylglycerol kinase family enzyme